MSVCDCALICMHEIAVDLRFKKDFRSLRARRRSSWKTPYTGTEKQIWILSKISLALDQESTFLVFISSFKSVVKWKELSNILSLWQLRAFSLWYMLYFVCLFVSYFLVLTYFLLLGISLFFPVYLSSGSFNFYIVQIRIF